MNKINAYTAALLVLLVVSQNLYADRPVEHNNFLTISDIHFDPFYSCNEKEPICPIVYLLDQKPITEWDNVFAQIDQAPAEYGRDTGYTLFKSSLEKLNTLIKTQPINFAIVGGDLVVHDFQDFYFKYHPHADDSDFEQFAAKLFAYIALKLKQSMTPIDVYMTVGNNDTFGKHYTSTANFYKTIGPIWSGLIHDKTKQALMEDEFIKNGYYSIDADQQLKLIFLNSTFFSPKFTSNTAVAATDQLNWLRQNLQAAVAKNQKVIIISHIPAGIDTYATISQEKITVLWREEYLQEFYAIIKAFKPAIITVLTAHLHADWMQSQKLQDTKIFMTSIPAISPQFGNNPAFKMYQLNQDNSQLENYKVYYLPLDENASSWKLEYRFSDIYPGKLTDVVDLINKTGRYAEIYKKYYSISQESQPISKGKWSPYYWCALRHALPNEYGKCLAENA